MIGWITPNKNIIRQSEEAAIVGKRIATARTWPEPKVMVKKDIDRVGKTLYVAIDQCSIIIKNVVYKKDVLIRIKRVCCHSSVVKPIAFKPIT